MLRSDDDTHIFEWSIANFSSCTLQHGEKLECPTSTARNLHDTRWTVVIYPKGKVDPNYLGCFLRRQGEDDGPETITVEYSISVIASDGVPADRRSGKAEFERNYCFGSSRFLRLRAIFCSQEFLLPSDALTIVCKLRMLCPKSMRHTERIFTTHFPIQKLTTRLTLNNYRATTKQKPIVWNMRVGCDLLLLKVSMNKDETSKYQIQKATFDCKNPEATSESFLHMVMTKKEAGEPIHISCWIKVLNSSLDFEVDTEISHLFSKMYEKEEWILPYFIDTENLPQDCIADNKLLLEFEVTICDRTPQSELFGRMTRLVSTLDPKESTLKKDLEDMYETGKFSDVILLVGDKSFPAHKSILAARSPKFAEIFSHSQQHIEVIVDVDKHTMALLLKFIYTDTLEEAMSDEECLLLYSAAHKYQISSLQCRCAKFLRKNLSVKAVYKALVIAEELNDSDLRLIGTDYILDHYHSDSLPPEWQTFSEQHEELSNQLKIHVEFQKQRF